MIGQLFAGDENLFSKAEAAKEVWQDGQGLWRSKQFVEEEDDSHIKTIRGSTIWDAKSSEELMALLGNLEEAQELVSKPQTWLLPDTGEPKFKMPRAGIQDESATAAEYMLLQESFDGVSRVTNAIRRCSHDMNQFDGYSARDMAERGVALCKVGCMSNINLFLG